MRNLAAWLDAIEARPGGYTVSYTGDVVAIEEDYRGIDELTARFIQRCIRAKAVPWIGHE